MSFVVAAAQYPIDALSDWDAYAEKLERWVSSAAAGGASLAVFPEYGAMELASLDPATMGSLSGSMAFVSSLVPQVDALHARLAARHGLHILAASMPCQNDDGRYVNRARLFTPSGRMGAQDKQIMTRFEREQWGVSSGGPLRLFDTSLGKIGVLICYDSEFPLLARALVEAGAELLLVPSCTDTLQGYWRVRIGARARALEGQCYTVHSPTIGDAPWSPAVDVNCGTAGIFAPPDGPFPDNGIVAEGKMHKAEWVFGEIDLCHIGMLRENGAVLNTRHWNEQNSTAGTLPVETLSLL